MPPPLLTHVDARTDRFTGRRASGSSFLCRIHRPFAGQPPGQVLDRPVRRTHYLCPARRDSAGYPGQKVEYHTAACAETCDLITVSTIVQMRHRRRATHRPAAHRSSQNI